VLNVAASTHFGSNLDMTEKAFDKMMDLNIKSTFFTVKESLHLLQKGKEPNILIMSSVAGKNPSPMIGIYSMTKAAMNSLTEVLAFELRADGIRVNALGPGVIKTNFAKPIWDSGMDVGEALGEPSQVAGLASCICSNDGSFCNGEVFYCHGGFAKI
jgi:dehydrogenase/reductase SDR family protein 4